MKDVILISDVVKSVDEILLDLEVYYTLKNSKKDRIYLKNRLYLNR